MSLPYEANDPRSIVKHATYLRKVRNRPDKALDILVPAFGRWPEDAYIANQLITLYRHDVIKAKIIFERYKHTTGKANNHICSNIITVYAKARQPQEAMKIFEWMQEKGLKPNVVTCNSLITAFANIIKQGKADAIMTAHVFNTNLDPICPATLSKTILTGILRKQLNYNGVIISDDMQMKAIVNHYGFETAIQTAIDAGVDIILIANNLVYEEDITVRTIAFIKKLVRGGKISEERINESYKRVQHLKNM